MAQEPAYRRLPDGAAGPKRGRHKLSIVPLVFLIYYEVSGGPFGLEDSVSAAGPLLAILGFLVVAAVWSIPEALITAELGTMFPENGGFVVWVSAALGPTCGFLQGWVKWLSGVIDNALYPVLFLDYLKSTVPALRHGAPRAAAAAGITVVLTYMNYRGLTIVGWASVALGLLTILPFAVMTVLAIPRLRPSQWLSVDVGNVNWSLYSNTLLWNLHYWDSVSTLAGEVDEPERTLPAALFWAAVLVITSNLLPILAGTGAIPVDRAEWTDGYFAIVADALGGTWLMWWTQVAAAVSNMGMFIAEMSSDSFQLLGMAERGMLPEAFARRSRHGTPVVGILFSAAGVLLLSSLSFQEIIAAENILYCLGMLMEFAAFIVLRVRHPAAARPFRVPLGTMGCVAMLAPATALIAAVMVFSTAKVAAVSLAAVAFGAALGPCLRMAEKRGCLRFAVNPDLAELREGGQLRSY